jgi:hypothetical protein
VRGSHQVTRVDLAAGTAESVARGPGQVAMVTGKDGDVFVQLGARAVERFATIADVGTASGEALLAGILIVPPAGGRMCCGL